MKPNENNKVLFGNLIRSNGFDLDCLFYKRKKAKKDPIHNLELKITDFALEEVKQYYEPIFIDPGRTSVFTGAKGLDIKNHSLLRCSTKEYYHYTGSTKFAVAQNKLKQERGINKIESAIPTSKTVNLKSYKHYCEYLFEHLDTLLDFYNFKTTMDKFFLYQGRQRAPALMTNMLVDGGLKYNRSEEYKKKQLKRKEKKNKNKQEANKKAYKEKRKKKDCNPQGRSPQNRVQADNKK